MRKHWKGAVGASLVVVSLALASVAIASPGSGSVSSVVDRGRLDAYRDGAERASRARTPSWPSSRSVRTRQPGGTRAREDTRDGGIGILHRVPQRLPFAHLRAGRFVRRTPLERARRTQRDRRHGEARCRVLRGADRRRARGSTSHSRRGATPRSTEFAATLHARSWSPRRSNCPSASAMPPRPVRRRRRRTGTAPPTGASPTDSARASHRSVQRRQPFYDADDWQRGHGSSRGIKMWSVNVSVRLGPGWTSCSEALAGDGSVKFSRRNSTPTTSSGAGRQKAPTRVEW